MDESFDSAKEVAVREIEKRIVTKEMAKASFTKWIDAELKYNYPDHVKEFWKEVRAEVQKL